MNEPVIIVVGASAGGFGVLQRLAAGLPPDLPAALFVVWHLSPDSQGVLPQVLGRAGPLPAAHAIAGETISAGRIYVAPPDHHLLVERGHVRVTRGPKEHRFRPAVDPLFRSAASAYGPRVVGVVLSGALDDGAAGLRAIKRRGGVAVAQDPLDAEVPSMRAAPCAPSQSTTWFRQQSWPPCSCAWPTRRGPKQRRTRRSTMTLPALRSVSRQPRTRSRPA